MIHTDGIPTIAHYPFEVVAELIINPDEIEDGALVSRSNNGIDVEIFVISDELWLRVTDEDGAHAAKIPSGKWRDAFEHPYCYLA